MNNDRGLCERLREMGLNVFEREQWNRVERRQTKMLGWRTDSVTRGHAIEVLAAAIRETADGVNDGIDVWSVEAIEQMEAFIVKASGRAEAMSGKHDDDVLSIAIGLCCMSGATVYRAPRRRKQKPADWKRWRKMK
jgi:hypothetical protein